MRIHKRLAEIVTHIMMIRYRFLPFSGVKQLDGWGQGEQLSNTFGILPQNLTHTHLKSSDYQNTCDGTCTWPFDLESTPLGS